MDNGNRYKYQNNHNRRSTENICALKSYLQNPNKAGLEQLDSYANRCGDINALKEITHALINCIRELNGKLVNLEDKLLTARTTNKVNEMTVSTFRKAIENYLEKDTQSWFKWSRKKETISKETLEFYTSELLTHMEKVRQTLEENQNIIREKDDIIHKLREQNKVDKEHNFDKEEAHKESKVHLRIDSRLPTVPDTVRRLQKLINEKEDFISSLTERFNDRYKTWATQDEEYKKNISSYTENLLKMNLEIKQIQDENTSLKLEHTELTNTIKEREKKISWFTDCRKEELHKWASAKESHDRVRIELSNKIIELENSINFSQQSAKRAQDEYEGSLRYKTTLLTKKEKEIEHANNKIDKLVREVEITNFKASEEIERAKEEYEKLSKYKNQKIDKQEKEIIFANEKIQKLLCLKQHVLGLAQENSKQHVTSKIESKLHEFRISLEDYSKPLSIQQIKERAQYISVKMKLDRIDEIRDNIAQYENEIRSFNGGRNDQRYLHLREILIRVLEDLDGVASNGNEEIQMARKSAIVYTNMLYNQLVAK